MANFCSRRRAPRYRLHKATGQAVVTIDGKDVYLGKHGTAASREAYQERIDAWKKSLKRTVVAPNHRSSVTELVVAYLTRRTCTLKLTNMPGIHAKSPGLI